MATGPKREKPLVMVADDDLATRELFAAYLQPEGYTVVLVSSGAEAVEIAIRLMPDLIIMDVLMRGMGGLQTFFVLKHTPQTAEIPAIVVSVVNERLLSLMPAVAFLSKPVDPKQFLATVRKLVNTPAAARP